MSQVTCWWESSYITFHEMFGRSYWNNRRRLEKGRNQQITQSNYKCIQPTEAYLYHTTGCICLHLHKEKTTPLQYWQLLLSVHWEHHSQEWCWVVTWHSASQLILTVFWNSSNTLFLWEWNPFFLLSRELRWRRWHLYERFICFLQTPVQMCGSDQVCGTEVCRTDQPPYTHLVNTQAIRW